MDAMKHEEISKATLVGLVLGLLIPFSAAAQNETGWLPPDDAFRKVILDEDQVVDGEIRDTVVDPMELTVAPDGRVFWAERPGTIKMWVPGSEKTVVIGEFKVFSGLEEGMLGITLDPHFASNQWIYLNRSLPDTYEDSRGGKAGKIRVSRYTLAGNSLDLESEKVIIETEVQREQCCHVGGSLAFDKDGNLYISIGDNTNPFDSDGYSPHDDRPGRYPWDATGTSANANSLVGKILRITPLAEGGYSIPDGNLFPVGTEGTRPEIFVMGCRNPFRISLDSKTGYLYWGEVGPDAGSNHLKRGPAGFDEVNQARSAGFYGWPMFVADNKPYVKTDFVARKKYQDAVQDREKAKKAELPEAEWPAAPGPWEGDDLVSFDPEKPMNHSANNTGIVELPPAQPAMIYYPHSPSARFPAVGSGGRTAMAGPVYYYDPNNPSPHKLPKEFDRTLFIYEWSRNWIVAVKLDENHQIVRGADRRPVMQQFLSSMTFLRPMDMELGPDGCLYLIEFGKDWGNNKDTKIIRIEYHGDKAKETKETASAE
jgi:cytochrome c